MSHDPHLGFVVAAYAFAFVVIAGMIFTILADYLTLKRALAAFGERAGRNEAGQDDLTPQIPESMD
jgi:heme exporter protein CcmD